MEDPAQYCAHCERPVPFFGRYPNYICRDCQSLLTDEHGRKVGFYNTHALGYGCQGYFLDTDPKELYQYDYCFIGDQKFKAQEFRFGGIVIEKVVNNSR